MAKKTKTNDIFESHIVLSMFLQFHRNTIESEVNSFKEYIIDSRNNISKQQVSFNKMIEEEKKKHPDNINDLIDAYENQYYQINEFYPATFNNSTLLSLYSLFEFNLKSLCVTLQECEELKIKLGDINGQGYIDTSNKYLILVADLDLTELKTTWMQITLFQQLRNCIVHNNSSILTKKNQVIKDLEIYKYIKKNPNLKINKENGIFIISDDQFLLDTLDAIEKYLISVIKKLESKYK